MTALLSQSKDSSKAFEKSESSYTVSREHSNTSILHLGCWLKREPLQPGKNTERQVKEECAYSLINVSKIRGVTILRCGILIG